MDSTYTLKYQNRVMQNHSDKEGPLPYSIATSFDDATGIPSISIKVGTAEMTFAGPIAWDLIHRISDAHNTLLLDVDRTEKPT